MNYLSMNSETMMRDVSLTQLSYDFNINPLIFFPKNVLRQQHPKLV